MELWILIWKVTFIGGMVLFGMLAAYVTVFGARDIKHLLATLKASSDRDPS
jgi:hypothetical protein